MDPNANLIEQRRLTQNLLRGSMSRMERYVSCERLCELVEALDEWLTNGGFLPEAWSRPERPARGK